MKKNSAGERKPSSPRDSVELCNSTHQGYSPEKMKNIGFGEICFGQANQ